MSHNSIDKALTKYLSLSGILGDLTSHHVWSTLLYLPISNEQIYSLEYSPDAAFKHLYLDDSALPLELLAKSLLQLYIESSYKLRITNIYLKGPKSVQFWEIYRRLLNSHLQTLSDTQRKIIDDIDDMLFLNVHSFYTNSVDLISLDRSNDLISCLLSQLSYSGLCNETFDIKSQLTKINIKPDSTDSPSINLNDSNDKIYPLIKYLNFSHVGPTLNKHAKILQLKFDDYKKLDNIDEMKNFVNELNNLKSLQSYVSKHTDLAAFIMHTFEDINDTVSIPILDEPDDDIGNDTSISGPGFNVLHSYNKILIELQQDILSNQLSVSSAFNRITSLLNSFDSTTLSDVFKLVILTSIIKRGFKESEFLPLYNVIINKFGILKTLPILINLQKLKIIQFSNHFSAKSNPNSHPASFLTFSALNPDPSATQNIQNFSLLVKSLSLLPTYSEEITNPGVDSIDQDFTTLYNDADFGYPGYVPIFARLVQSIYSRSFQLKDSNQQTESQRAIKYGWNNIDLEGLSSTTLQEFLVPDSKKKLFSSIIPPKISDLKNSNKSTIIICAVGGITWSEIATIKYVLKSNPFTKDKSVIVLTTGLLTSDGFINSFAKAS